MDTIEQLQQRLATTTRFSGGYEIKPITRQVTCMDGVTLSVQASTSHYSSPKTNTGPWTKVEVGYPKGITAMPQSWQEYAEDSEPVSDIYAYIPIELVAQFIDEHGGIKD